MRPFSLESATAAAIGHGQTAAASPQLQPRAEFSFVGCGADVIASRHRVKVVLSDALIWDDRSIQ